MADDEYGISIAGKGYESSGGYYKEEAKEDKKAVTDWVLVTIWCIVGLLALIVILVGITKYTSLSIPISATQTTTIATGINKLTEPGQPALISYIGKVLQYGSKFIFGIDISNTQSYDSNIIIIIASWFVFFLVIGDLIVLFSMGFGHPKAIAFFITLIFANLGLLSGTFYLLMELFAFLASFAIIGVLASIMFFAFVAHWGLTGFALRMMQRRAMMEAANIKNKGKKLASTVGALLDVGKAIERG